MRLASVQVRDFRCVEDSEKFSIDQVTCLVGKNESGKTALLKALHKLKPDAVSKETFEPSRDYPKRKWRPGTTVPADPPTVATIWELDDQDVAAVEKAVGAAVLRERTFRLTKGYDNVRRYGVTIDEAAVVKELIAEAKLSSAERKPLLGTKTVSALQKALEEMPQRNSSHDLLLGAVKKRFPDGVMQVVINTIDERLPTFLYFDEYLTLPGTVSVNAVMSRQNQKTLEERDRVFLALLSLAGTTIKAVQSAGTFEEFNSSLRAVSNQITDQIFKYWSQNRHLGVNITVDYARPQDPPPFNEGWVFRTRIENRRHRADTSFDERSRGFVWFFSFLIWFYQLRELYGKNLIILLDEPGLSLHARAQGDLLRYINEQLRPHYQVIYTTHSPFMVDADNLLSARTVEDVVVRDTRTGEERLLGTKVGEDVLSTDPDTVSPLQRALDYELTQTLFIGKHTLLVEGPSDLLYLKWFSRQLQKAAGVGLDYRWNVSIVGGVDRIPGFVSLFRGNGLHIAAMVDVKQGDKGKIEKARASLLEGHLVTVDKYANQSEADIEDVLGREFYGALVARVLDLRAPHLFPSKKPADAPDRIVKEVENFAALLPPHYPNFDHFIPAEWLFQHEDEGATLPGFADALARMEHLIADLNNLLK